MDYYIYRLNNKGELGMVLDGIDLPFYNEHLFHFDAIPIEALQFNAEQFEFYKHLLIKNKTYFHAIKQIYLTYRCSGNDKFHPERLSEEILQILLLSDLLLDSEKQDIESHRAKVEIQLKKEARKAEPTFIYLMKDERTELTKIGHSKNPSYRERTLQSDNPMIVLLGAWLGTQADEKMLHEKFAHRRFRGEWFELFDDDIQEIQAIFSDRETWSN
jgi:hypothetical protein